MAIILKPILFLCTFYLCILNAKADFKNSPHSLRHNWWLRKHGLISSPWSENRSHDEHRKQWFAKDDAGRISATRNIFKLLGESEDKEELSTPTSDSEILSYGDDAKNYKVGLPLPQKKEDVETLNLMCHVPTRRGMIVTHCGLADDEGTCPVTKSCGFVIPHFWTLPKLCLSDFDCTYAQKCCPHSCYQHKICQHPVSENTKPSVNHIDIKQFINLFINKSTPETLESILNSTLNETNIEGQLWNLTASNSSYYNLTISYNNETVGTPTLNLTNTNNTDVNHLNLAISNRTHDDLPFINGTKEYEPVSNSTFNGTKEYDSDESTMHYLPKTNPFDPDAETDGFRDFSGSGSVDEFDFPEPS